MLIFPVRHGPRPEEVFPVCQLKKCGLGFHLVNNIQTYSEYILGHVCPGPFPCHEPVLHGPVEDNRTMQSSSSGSKLNVKQTLRQICMLQSLRFGEVMSLSLTSPPSAGVYMWTLSPECHPLWRLYRFKNAQLESKYQSDLQRLNIWNTQPRAKDKFQVSDWPH